MADAATQAAECRQARAQLTGPNGVLEASREAVREGCFRQVQSDLLLREIQLRRARFVQQADEGVALIVTVIIITIAGVALSAVQFVATYRLASAGQAAIEQASQLTIERDRITLKSSVTGLFILACSLAFFMIFVLYVHPIREVSPMPTTGPISGGPLQLGTNEIVPDSAPSAASR